MASKFYKSWLMGAWGSTAVNFTGDVYRVMLMKSSYTFDENHDFVDDISASEISLTGYSRQTLAGKSVNWDNTNKRAYIDATDPNWASIAAGDTIGGAVIYRQTGGNDSTPANDDLVCFLDPTDLVTNGSSVTLQFDATNGIGYLGG